MGDDGLVKLVQIEYKKKINKKKESHRVIKDWQLSEKKRWNFQRNAARSPLSFHLPFTHLRTPHLRAGVTIMDAAGVATGGSER